MQKVKAEYEMCYKKYQKTTMEMEKASNRSIGTQEDLKSLCWWVEEQIFFLHVRAEVMQSKYLSQRIRDYYFKDINRK